MSERALTPEQRAQRLFEAVRGHLARAITPLYSRISSLEKQPVLRMAGVFEPGACYAAGHVVLHARHLWIAVEETGSAPGIEQGKWLRFATLEQ
jgi:hypothetical protein